MIFNKQFIDAILKRDKTATCRIFKRNDDKPQIGHNIELTYLDEENRELVFALVKVVGMEYSERDQPIWFLSDHQYATLGHGDEEFPVRTYEKELLSCYPDYNGEPIVYYEWELLEDSK